MWLVKGRGGGRPNWGRSVDHAGHARADRGGYVNWILGHA